MMRLIDADELINWICNDSGDNLMDEYYIEHINNMPEVYDVDKVVEELKRISVPERVKLHGIETETVKVIRLKYAVDIVKGGGVAEDVCEWKSDYGFVSDKYKREASCGHTFYDLHHAVAFKYCPYCGKKIKVVE